MAYNFPDSPTPGQVFNQWTWNGSAWVLTTPSNSAASMTFAPAGDIVATNVQAAIVEVDAEMHAADAAEIVRADAAYQAKDPQLFAGIPINNKSATYTLLATDAQKCIVGLTNAMQIIIPPDASVNFPIGTAVSMICWVGGTISLVAGSGVNAYFNIGGVVSQFPRTMSNVGMATCVKVAANTWFCSGSGVT